MEASALTKRTVKELREMLKESGLPVTGKKAELIERLLSARGSDASDGDDQESGSAESSHDSDDDDAAGGEEAERELPPTTAASASQGNDEVDESSDDEPEGLSFTAAKERMAAVEKAEQEARRASKKKQKKRKRAEIEQEGSAEDAGALDEDVLAAAAEELEQEEDADNSAAEDGASVPKIRRVDMSVRSQKLSHGIHVATHAAAARPYRKVDPAVSAFRNQHFLGGRVRRDARGIRRGKGRLGPAANFGQSRKVGSAR